MNRPYVPQPVLDAAHARSAARAARDWAAADRLRDEIEAAGWRIIDSGTDFKLEPAHAPDVEADGIVRYGRSSAVPSRLDEPATGLATVVIVAGDDPGDLRRAVASVRVHAPARVDVVIVADGPSAEVEASLGAVTLGEAGAGTEIVRTSQRLGQGASLNIGLRRSTGETVIVIDPSVEATGDFITPLADALGEPDIAIVGPFGLRSADLRGFSEVSAGGPAAAIEGYLMAFRRRDAAARGPLDEGFRFYRNLDIWWSLVLRDGGPGLQPRRAIVVPDLPVVRHEHRGWTSLSPAERERLSKRNFYRLLERFRDRPDLAVGEDET